MSQRDPYPGAQMAGVIRRRLLPKNFPKGLADPNFAGDVIEIIGAPYGKQTCVSAMPKPIFRGSSAAAGRLAATIPSAANVASAAVRKPPAPVARVRRCIIGLSPWFRYWSYLLPDHAACGVRS